MPLDPKALAELASHFDSLLSQHTDPVYFQRIWGQFVSTKQATDPIASLKNFLKFYRESHTLMPNELMDSGITPLHRAVWDHYDIYLEYLCQSHPNLDVNVPAGTASYRKTLPIHHAASRGNFLCFLILERANASLNTLDDSGNSCLHNAAASGNALLVRHLLANPNFALDNPNSLATRLNTQGQSALHVAILNRHTACVNALKEAIPDVKDDAQNTALHCAVSAGSLDMIVSYRPLSRELLSATNQQGKTALGLAIDMGNVDLVRELLQAGAPCEVTTNPAADVVLSAASKYFNSNFTRRAFDIYHAVLLHAQEQHVDFSQYADELPNFRTGNKPEQARDLQAFQYLINGTQRTDPQLSESAK